mgnify:CR=1 FL=1
MRVSAEDGTHVMYGLPACLALEHCVHEARGLDVLCLGASLPFCLSNLSALCRLWESAQKTAHSLPARLAVEHCVHEARGLDVLPSTVHKFKNNGDAESAALLEDVIYAVSTGGPWGPHGCSAIVEAALHCLVVGLSCAPGVAAVLQLKLGYVCTPLSSGKSIKQKPLYTCVLHAEGGEFAAEFSKSPDFKKLSCGWATKDEVNNTSSACNLCGNAWCGPVTTLPTVFEPFPAGYSNCRAPGFVSLACRPGRLLVRAVFKMLTAPIGRQVGGILGAPLEGSDNASSVRRCDLELPPHQKSPSSSDKRKSETSKSEIEAALRSKEVNCKPTSDFAVMKIGQWYSDTVTFDYPGCKGVEQKGEYKPTMPYILRNPERGFLLAKFEVQEAQDHQASMATYSAGCPCGAGRCVQPVTGCPHPHGPGLSRTVPLSAWYAYTTSPLSCPRGCRICVSMSDWLGPVSGVVVPQALFMLLVVVVRSG